jgi:DNA topoisomerase-1
MSYKLLIVESPAKAKTIEKYLKDLGNFKVTASVGHVRDLPKSNKTAIDIEAGFVPNYEISKGKEKVISDITKLAKKADEVLLATDPDREGEAIAWHLKEALNLKKPKRIVFNEITEEAVKEAVQNPREIDIDLKTAQEARRVLDRLVGYDLSGLIWKKVRYGLSAGRVQSPALRIIMERERLIRAFIPETFWVLDAKLKSSDKTEIDVVCEEEIKEKKEVERILSDAKKEDWKILDIKKANAKRQPKAPFTTSTLQQTSSTRLGFSPANTMRIAQKLYEAGHITYMRTDSPTLSKLALGQAASVIEKDFGKEFHQLRTYGKTSKNAQEAHEAVRPTNISKKNVGNTAEQKKLYNLIWSRTVASQMVDAKVLRTKIVTNTQSENIPNFSVNGQIIVEEGWIKADPMSRSEDVTLPNLEAGEKLDLLEINDLEKETQPPSRYTEAGLVKELEKRGIGRPSTYASIIKTLIDRFYVEKQGRTLFPTDTGDVVSSFLEEHFDTYISDNFTADMEEQLDDIAEGKREYVKTLKDFYTEFSKEIESKEDIAKLTTLGRSEEFKCPKCKAGMDIKLSRMGKFLSCEKFPECDGALSMEGKELRKDEPLGTDPETELPVFLLDGRFGPYVQIGNKETLKKGEKPRRASVPRDKNVEEVKLEDALVYLSLPRVLGVHPTTGEEITASIGRFGPFVVHQADFRSLKEDSPYDITLERALEIFAEPKKRRGAKKVAKKKAAKKKKTTKKK